jgi:hypothetical protein
VEKGHEAGMGWISKNRTAIEASALLFWPHLGKAGRYILEVVGLGGSVDFLLSRFAQPDWVGKVLEFLLNPPDLVKLISTVLAIVLVVRNERKRAEGLYSRKDADSADLERTLQYRMHTLEERLNKKHTFLSDYVIGKESDRQIDDYVSFINRGLEAHEAAKLTNNPLELDQFGSRGQWSSMNTESGLHALLGLDALTVRAALDAAKAKIRNDARYVVVDPSEAPQWKDGDTKQHWHVKKAVLEACRDMANAARKNPSWKRLSEQLHDLN